jgi:hypothetical protein
MFFGDCEGLAYYLVDLVGQLPWSFDHVDIQAEFPILVECAVLGQMRVHFLDEFKNILAGFGDESEVWLDQGWGAVSEKGLQTKINIEGAMVRVKALVEEIKTACCDVGFQRSGGDTVIEPF